MLRRRRLTWEVSTPACCLPVIAVGELRVLTPVYPSGILQTIHDLPTPPRPTARPFRPALNTRSMNAATRLATAPPHHQACGKPPRAHPSTVMPFLSLIPGLPPPPPAVPDAVCCSERQARAGAS